MMPSTSHRPLLALAAVIACGLSLMIAPTGGAFTAQIANSQGTAGTASYFTCTRAYVANTPTLALALNEPTSSTSAANFAPGGAAATYRGAMSTSTATPKACPRDSGGAYVLNGSTSYASSATLVSGTASFTLEIWFKTTTGGGKLIGFGSSRTGASTNVDRHLYLTNSGQVVFGVFSTAVRTIQSPRSYLDGVWHQAVATLSTAGMRLYIDGAQVAQDTATTSARAMTGYWRIGYDKLTGWGATVPTNFYFTGQLRFAAVYATALTATNVATHYRAGT